MSGKLTPRVTGDMRRQIVRLGYVREVRAFKKKKSARQGILSMVVHQRDDSAFRGLPRGDPTKGMYIVKRKGYQTRARKVKNNQLVRLSRRP